MIAVCFDYLYVHKKHYIRILAEVSTSVYEISNITAEKPLKIRVFQLFIIFDNVVPIYYLYFLKCIIDYS